MSKAADIHELAKAALAGTKGGKRPGAGRKVGSKDGPNVTRNYTPRKKKSDAGPDMPLDISDLLGGVPASTPRSALSPLMDDNIDGDTSATLYAQSRARKEDALASLAELRLKTQSALYLPKAAFVHGNAVAQQTIAQALRTIPDTLERKLGVTPAVASEVATYIEAALGELSIALEEIFNEATKKANEPAEA